jgi:hypothetical protein
MRARPPIIWHRFAAEIFDPQILRHLHELYLEYVQNVEAKRRTQPFANIERLNLTKFTIHVFQTGIETVTREISDGGDKIK